MNDKEMWTQVRNLAVEKLDAIQEIENKREAAEIVGKYFKYNNSYGSGDRFWTYAKVINVSNSDGYVNVIECEIDCYGKASITGEERRYSNFDMWTKSTKSEFDGALRRASAALGVGRGKR